MELVFKVFSAIAQVSGAIFIAGIIAWIIMLISVLFLFLTMSVLKPFLS